MKWNAYLYSPRFPGKYMYIGDEGFDADCIENAWEIGKVRARSYIVIGIDTQEDFRKYTNVKNPYGIDIPTFYLDVKKRLIWLMENEPEKVNSTEVYKSVFR
jgi:hypothetical protein